MIDRHHQIIQSCVETLNVQHYEIKIYNAFFEQTQSCFRRCQYIQPNMIFVYQNYFIDNIIELNCFYQDKKSEGFKTFNAVF